MTPTCVGIKVKLFDKIGIAPGLVAGSTSYQLKVLVPILPIDCVAVNVGLGSPSQTVADGEAETIGIRGSSLIINTTELLILVQFVIGSISVIQYV